MTSPARLPSGFTLRTQGGSTYLEIDLSHFDPAAIREFASSIAGLQGYTEKPRRKPWAGRKPRQDDTPQKPQKRRQRRPSAH